MFINLTWNYKIKLKFLDELLAVELKKPFWSKNVSLSKTEKTQVFPNITNSWTLCSSRKRKTKFSNA